MFSHRHFLGSVSVSLLGTEPGVRIFSGQNVCYQLKTYRYEIFNDKHVWQWVNFSGLAQVFVNFTKKIS
jgi:hypothetical protein